MMAHNDMQDARQEARGPYICPWCLDDRFITMRPAVIMEHTKTLHQDPRPLKDSSSDTVIALEQAMVLICRAEQQGQQMGLYPG